MNDSMPKFFVLNFYIGFKSVTLRNACLQKELVGFDVISSIIVYVLYRPK